jgi:hypothetical protein
MKTEIFAVLNDCIGKIARQVRIAGKVPPGIHLILITSIRDAYPEIYNAWDRRTFDEN